MSFWRYIPHKIPTAQSNDDERACWDQWVLGTSEWFTAASDEALDTWVICAERPWWAACWRCNSASSVRCCGTAGWTDLEHIVLHDSLLSSYAWSQSHSWHTRQKNQKFFFNCYHKLLTFRTMWSVLCEQADRMLVGETVFVCWHQSFIHILSLQLDATYLLTEFVRSFTSHCVATGHDRHYWRCKYGCTRSRSVLCYRCHHHSCV